MGRNLFLIVIIFLAIIATLLLGNVFVIGDKLGQFTQLFFGDKLGLWTHLYVEVEYTFYIILIFLVIIYVIRPFIMIRRSPDIPIITNNKKDLETWDKNSLLKFARQLAANCNYIGDKNKRNSHKRELLRDIQYNSAEIEELRNIVSKEIDRRIKGDEELNVLGINNRIKEWGKTVFMVTAISQNNKFDTLAVLVMNYNLISDIVLASGFRPTKPQMLKLYIKVLTTALVTYCTSKVFTDVKGVAPFDFDNSTTEEITMGDDSDVDVDLDKGDLGASIMKSLEKLEIPGALLGSAMDGCLNALMTLRIGYITKAYLTKGATALSGTKNKRKVKREAIKEAFSAMPSVIAVGGASLGKAASALLTGKFQIEKNNIYNEKESQQNEDNQQL